MECVAASGNKTLYRLMHVDIVRDGIMDGIAPMDVFNFVVGTGIKFE